MLLQVIPGSTRPTRLSYSRPAMPSYARYFYVRISQDRAGQARLDQARPGTPKTGQARRIQDLLRQVRQAISVTDRTGQSFLSQALLGLVWLVQVRPGQPRYILIFFWLGVAVTSKARLAHIFLELSRTGQVFNVLFILSYIHYHGPLLKNFFSQ